jgi:hypothetical protein|tara:strand:+ start:669 stop:3398 length:2730 start_codon:yes stop_codon:yes gene_type:complete
VANYDVDIEIALQGAQKITALTKDIKSLNKEVNAINKGATRLGKAIDKAFRVDSVQNYSRALNQAERALRNVAAGTDAERRAVERVVRMRREANDALARQNMLLAQAAANQREVIATANAGFGMQGPSLPKDFFKVQGPKLPPGFTEAGRKPKAAPRISGRDRIGAAVSAGAFPLLFGGGPGMALGGAIGGAAAGATFGPAAIALQVLGGALDQFVAQVATTGQALNEFTFDFAEVTRAAGLAGTATSTYIEQIAKLADSTEAQEIATKALSVRVGGQAVESLKTFGEASADLGREFSTATTIVGSAIASLITPLTQFTAKVLEANNALVAGRANVTNDPELRRLAAREAQLQGSTTGLRTGGRSVQALKDAEELRKVQEQIRDRQREINLMLQETTRIRAEDLQRLDNELNIQTDNLHVLALRRELLQNGKELSEEELAVAKENIEKGRIQVKRERLLLEQAQLIERAKKGELSFRKVALIIAGKQLEIDEALQKLETKGSDKTGPKSRALQLQAAILREKLKQFGIEMDVQSLNETTVQSLQRQNKGIEERRDKEIQILEFQRQQELANNKVAGDAKFINKLYDERKQTIRDTLGLELDQNNARIKAIELQQKLTRMRADQKTAGIGRGLRRQIEDAQRGMANPFDSNELQMLQLRVDQVRRSDDAYRSLNEQIAENNALIKDPGATEDQIEKAKANNKVLQERIDIYRNLLPQLEAVEQAQLRQQQIIDQLTPATEAFAGALVDTVTGAQTAQEAFANFLRSVANMLAETAKKMISQYIAIGIARMFAGIPSGGNRAANPEISKYTNITADTDVSGLVPRANGGPVGTGRPYLVGERGPELFVPGAQGNIVPNSAMGGTSVVVNVDASGTEVQGNQNNADQLGRLIGQAVQAELIKQKRPGGLLTR